MDINSYISIHTLNKLDNNLLDYKKNILKHFYNNFLKDKTIDYQNFENKYLENNPTIIERSINDKKCMARVQYKTNTYKQCDNYKKNGDYCNIHFKNSNYGNINDLIN
tara:strand:+ start:85 stop:408 length:324 start_codon:yes stop_codon:yes gene_type:complete